MKKFTLITLAFALALSLAACGGNGTEPAASPRNTAVQEPETEQPSGTAGQEPETEQLSVNDANVNDANVNDANGSNEVVAPATDEMPAVSPYEVGIDGVPSEAAVSVGEPDISYEEAYPQTDTTWSSLLTGVTPGDFDGYITYFDSLSFTNKFEDEIGSPRYEFDWGIVAMAYDPDNESLFVMWRTTGAN